MVAHLQWVGYVISFLFKQLSCLKLIGQLPFVRFFFLVYENITLKHATFPPIIVFHIQILQNQSRLVEVKSSLDSIAYFQFRLLHLLTYIRNLLQSPGLELVLMSHNIIYIYIYTCICVCMCVYIYIYIYINLSISIYLHIQICLFLCIYLSMHICEYICIYVQ